MKQSLRTLWHTHRVLCIIIGITVALIWLQSALPAGASDQESGFVLSVIRPVLEVFVGSGNVTNHLVRKLAHFTEFAMLGGELALAAGTFWKAERADKDFGTGAGAKASSAGAGAKASSAGAGAKALTAGAGTALLVAVLDEAIQFFSSGRAPMVSDVLLDFAGALTGLLLMTLILWLFRQTKAAQQSQKRD
jgi:VanZ family protein